MPAPAVFRHEAMACPWEIFLPDDPGAAALADAAFRELDTLEAELTRFRPDSDIGRLQSLTSGQSTRVGPAAMDCLLLARDVHAATDGAFDVTIGHLVECWNWARSLGRKPSRSERTAAAGACGMHLLELDPVNLTITVHTDHPIVDLGGIGKGYAADQLAESLRPHTGAHGFLINAGSSTVLAHGSGPEGRGWPVRLGKAPEPTLLVDCSVSGSGVAVKGSHILDPSRQAPAKTSKQNHLWVKAALASVSDAFSTALFILPPDKAMAVCARYPEIEVLRTENLRPKM